MLNISNNPLNKTVDLTKFRSAGHVFGKQYYKYFNRFLTGFALTAFIILFFPWTQNITGRGEVTTLTPDQRPQTIQSPIPGRIVAWHVREGNLVKKGDTIMQIAEVKSEYFDPQLVERTGQMRDAKAFSAKSYEQKVKAKEVQIEALKKERVLKLKQARNKLYQSKLKVQEDSINLEAAKTNMRIATTRFDRAQELQNDGIISLKDFEEARLKFQENEAKLISQRAKLAASQNEVINAEVNISSTDASYIDKISKAESEKFAALSGQLDTEAQVTKLDNEVSNYQIRNDLLFITAPHDGYINKALRGGIGVTFKEGEELVGIMPAQVDLAVETYVDPIDLPLMHLGEKVRIQFDGWPAIIFRGWPNVSYGTYGGEVVAVENFISPNGKFRILLKPDPNDHPWPEEIRAGSGAFTMALLEDVPIWFEIWRQLNGFPPNYYQPIDSGKTAKK